MHVSGVDHPMDSGAKAFHAAALRWQRIFSLINCFIPVIALDNCHCSRHEMICNKVIKLSELLKSGVVIKALPTHSKGVQLIQGCYTICCYCLPLFFKLRGYEVHMVFVRRQRGHCLRVGFKQGKSNPIVGDGLEYDKTNSNNPHVNIF